MKYLIAIWQAILADVYAEETDEEWEARQW